MQTRSANQKIMTTSEVAYYFRVHPNTIRQWTNRGLIPSFRLGTRRDRRFKREDVDEFLRKNDMDLLNDSSKD
jgi:excisionase family DNA binding protein